jgi:F-type H+-transporting ATPase subunit delta
LRFQAFHFAQGFIAMSASFHKPLPIEAQRYAQALYELASEQNVLPAVEADLKKLQELTEASRELRKFLSSPLLRRALMARGLAAVIDQAGAGKITKSFFQIVAMNGRGRDVPNIIRAFFVKAAKERGELRAFVATARPLNNDQTEALRAAILKAFAAQGAREIKIDAYIDPELLGGLRVQVGSFLFDGSIRGGLQKMRASLKTAA